MGKFYWGFIGAVVALFIYAGATGNFGIIPKLPFDLPFGHQLQPGAPILSAPILVPQLTGQIGINAGQLAKRFEQVGGTVRWERSTDERGWILRYSVPMELTGNVSEGAMRFNFLQDASQAGVSGPGLHAVGWAEDGYTMNPAEINMLLGSIAAAIYQEGQP